MVKLIIHLQIVSLFIFSNKISATTIAYLEKYEKIQNTCVNLESLECKELIGPCIEENGLIEFQNYNQCCDGLTQIPPGVPFEFYRLNVVQKLIQAPLIYLESLGAINERPSCHSFIREDRRSPAYWAKISAIMIAFAFLLTIFLGIKFLLKKRQKKSY